MTWVAAGTAAAGVVSSVIGSRSAKRAAKQQQEAAARGQQIAGGVYDQIRGDYQPYTALGTQSSNQLMRLLGNGTDGELTRAFTNEDFVKDPGYEWRLNEGRRAVEGSAASRGGGGLGGATLKALEKYGQGFGSNEYGKAYDRFTGRQDRNYSKLMGGTEVGLRGTGAVSVAGSRYGDQAVGLNSDSGNAAAAETIGQNNAIQSGIRTATNALTDLLARRQINANVSKGNLDWLRNRPPQPYGEDN